MFSCLFMVVDSIKVVGFECTLKKLPALAENLKVE